jgi:SAM-dependent methyltransferase
MSEVNNPHGFLIGGRPEDLFRGTAAYYARYRRPYPQAVVDHIVQRCGLNGHGRLLDAGCGTGQVFQVFAHWFGDVLAVDRDPDMIAYARKAAAELGLKNVTLRQMSVEELKEDVAPLRMTIFGASFHWTDRARVGNAIYDLTEPGGHLVVLAPNDIPRGNTDWEKVIQDVLKTHLGPERRAGTGTFQRGERHQDALKRTRFEKLEQTDVLVPEKWSVDQIVGHLYSTSYASKVILGDRAEAFERDLRDQLGGLGRNDYFEKINDITVILAER